MDKVAYCSAHNVPCDWKEGVSKKTGQSFAFWACPTAPVNGVYCKAAQEMRDAPKAEVREPLKERDYDAEARGKVRHGVSIAYIERGENLTAEVASEIMNWTDFIMSGSLEK